MTDENVGEKALVGVVAENFSSDNRSSIISKSCKNVAKCGYRPIDIPFTLEDYVNFVAAQDIFIVAMVKNAPLAHIVAVTVRSKGIVVILAAVVNVQRSIGLSAEVDFEGGSLGMGQRWVAGIDPEESCTAVGRRADVVLQE